MKRQISNEQTKTGQGLFFFVGLTILSIIGVFMIDKSDKDFSFYHSAITSFVIVCFIGLWYYISNGRFYKVLFDNDFIYYSRFKQKGQIGLDKIIFIQASIIPFKVFYKNVYSVTIEYLDNNDKERKIKFASKGTSVDGTIDEIPLLDTLKQLIKEKKYDR